MASADDYANWIVSNQAKNGTPEFDVVARAYQEAKGDPNAKYKAMNHVEPIDPTADMSFGQTLAAGAGKAISDVGLGVRQLVGAAPQAEVDASARRDDPLMHTWGGNIGNIGTQVGMALLPGGVASVAGKAAGMPALANAGRLMLAAEPSLAGIGTGAAMGGLQAGIQPVESGRSRLVNTAIGAGAGALVPAAGMALKTGKAAIEPLYPEGREQILGRVLRRAGGEGSDAAMAAMQGAKELVPGSAPTAGQAAGNAGIAALERSAFASEPSVTNTVADRLSSQNAARVAALRGLSGEGGAREASDAARQAAAGPLYKQAMEQGVDPAAAQALKPQINNLMERMPSGVLEKAKELARVNGETFDKAGSVQGLHWMKVAVDDMLSSGKQTGIGSQTTRALTQFKNDLLTVVDDLSPAYGEARQTFASMSKPVNQFDVAGEIAKRSIRPLDEQMMPTAYARALSDQTAQHATGFNKATLANVMEPSQLGTLNAIKEDLARSQFAQNAGRGAGSDTVQKLAFNNLMQQSGLQGLPSLLNRPVMMAEYLGRSVYGSADKEMRRMLAETLLDPAKAAAMMKNATPAERSMLAQALRSSAAPLAVGGATESLNR